MKIQCLFLAFLASVSAVKLNINDNTVFNGKTDTSYNGRQFYSFTGIPFAEPPIGGKRFQPIQPVKSYPEEVDATQGSPACAQGALGVNLGVEDCLYLNVFTPRLGQSPRGLPVLVWLHGGSFVLGESSTYDPYLLMDQDIVVVIPHYRLGLLGFLSSKTSHASGNMGLLDQVLALEWVRDHIGEFGGDPSKVTLGGDCAGGASAIYHMMSPLSKDLFHGVISLSGSPLSPWARSAPHRRLVLILATKVKCPAHDLTVLVNCLQEIDIKELLETQQDVVEARDLMIGNGQIGPKVQDPSSAHVSTLFLEEDPIQLLQEGRFHHVPVLMGVNRDIGGYLLDMVLYEFILYKLESKKDFVEKDMFQMLLKENGIWDYEEEFNTYKKFYIPNKNITDIDDLIEELSTMLGDMQYKAGIFKTASYLSKYTTTKLFRFEYEGGPKLFDLRHPDPADAPPFPKSFVGHGDDLFFLFPEDRRKMSEEQQQVSRDYIKMITDFMYKRSDNNLKWNKISDKDVNALVIKPDGKLQVEEFADEETRTIWGKIFETQFESYIEQIQTKRQHDEL